MALLPPPTRDRFLTDLSVATQAIRPRSVDGRTSSSERNWKLWVEFCATHTLSPMDIRPYAAVPLLCVFATRYRDGRIAPSGQPVRSGTVADVLRDVGQTYALMGAPDPRFDAFGNIDIRLRRLLRIWGAADDPPRRMKPIPIQVVRAVLQRGYNPQASTAHRRAVADMVCIAFFFLLRPGEYTVKTNNTPFRLCDVTLFRGTNPLPVSAGPADLLSITSATLTFTTQKNGVRGERITHGLSGDPLVCPCRALARRVAHLHDHGAAPTTPLCSYFSHNHIHHVSSKDITDALKLGLLDVGPNTVDIQVADISARSLRAGGATALLNANVDTNTIQLLGRWRSDAMLRYLHVSASSAVHRHAAAMFQGGTFSFRPGSVAPSAGPAP